jgi:hypothetical protein
MPIEQGPLWDEPALPADTKETASPPPLPVQKAPVRRVSGAQGRKDVYTDEKTKGYIYPTSAPLLGAPIAETDQQEEFQGILWQDPERHTLYTTGEPIAFTRVIVTHPGCQVVSPIGAMGEFREPIGSNVLQSTSLARQSLQLPGRGLLRSDKSPERECEVRGYSRSKTHCL